MRSTINELADFEFQIKYRPGVDNGAADAMSRIISAPTHTENDSNMGTSELPKGLRILKKVDGGADSLFISVGMCLEDLNEDEETIRVPEDHIQLRQEVVGHLLDNADKYNIKLDKEKRKWLNNMKRGGQVPCEQVLLAVCAVYGIEIWVHHGMVYPVIYKDERNGKEVSIIHLQCISGIHFNPVVGKQKHVDSLQKRGKITYLSHGDQDKKKDEPREKEEQDSEKQEEFTQYLYKVKEMCGHDVPTVSSCVVGVGSVLFCCLVDTGAQVSLLSDSVFREN
jgi:hypothetical protein